MRIIRIFRIFRIRMANPSRNAIWQNAVSLPGASFKGVKLDLRGEMGPFRVTIFAPWSQVGSNQDFIRGGPSKAGQKSAKMDIWAQYFLNYSPKLEKNDSIPPKPQNIDI